MLTNHNIYKIIVGKFIDNNFVEFKNVAVNAVTSMYSMYGNNDFYVYIIEKRGSFHIISNRGFDIEIDDMKINIRKRSSDKNVMNRINPIIDEIIADMSFYNDIDVVL